MTAAWLAKSPCEKLILATSMPARISPSMTSGEREAGPMVATILVLWSGRAMFPSVRCAPVYPGSTLPAARRRSGAILRRWT